MEQEDFPVVGCEAAWLLAEFGYRFGVRRPHQRLLHLEAVGNVARDEGSALGPRHAPVLYRLLCAAQAESFLTKTEASKHVQIVSGLSGLGRTWALDFRSPIPMFAPACAAQQKAGGQPRQLCDAGELTTSIVEIVLLRWRFVFKMMSYVLKMMSYVSKLMKSALNIMESALKMMSVLQILSAVEPFEQVCVQLTQFVQGAGTRCYNRLVRNLDTGAPRTFLQIPFKSH